MYKKQLSFQKIVCLLAVIAAAVSFVYSLGMITDIYDSLYSTMMNPDDLTQTYVPGSIIYYDMQDFNKLFLYCNIGLILLACFLYLTNTHCRRKYYVGNFLATAVCAVAMVGVSIWANGQITGFKNQYLTQVDFEALKEFAEMWNKPYIESTFLLDLHTGVLVLAVLVAVLLLGNAIWKVRLMRAERKLVEQWKEALV